MIRMNDFQIIIMKNNIAANNYIGFGWLLSVYLKHRTRI